MTSIRERVVEIIGGKQLRREREHNQEVVNTMWNAYQDGRFRVPPQMLIEQLSELDSSTVAYLLRAMGGLPLYATNMEEQRNYQVDESRWQWLYSPLSQWSVNVWTAFGLGERVSVVCNDEDAQEVWDKVWNYNAIFDDDHIQELSSSVLVNGDVYLAAFISVADGTVSFEYIDCDEIKEIITHPDNRNQALYYKREYTTDNYGNKTLYYPDWHAYFYKPADLEKASLPQDAYKTISEALDENNGTSAVILHIAHNRKDAASLHGWPILGIAAPYMRAHKEFMENRLTVSRQKAAFVREFITQGGSRGVAAVKAKFDSQMGSASSSTSTLVDPNPPAVAGSSLIHNAAVEHRDLPMSTGAGDAQNDNNMFSWMALIGAGLFPTTAGLDTSRWATAVAMDKTQAVQWSRYQSFWSAQFRKMVELVLLADEKWGDGSYEDKGCSVSIDTLALVDFPGVVGPISQMINSMSPLLADGTMPQNAAREILQALWMPVLNALGTENTDDILSDDNMRIVEPEQAEEMQKAMVNLALDIRRRKIAESQAVKESGAEKAGANGSHAAAR